MLVALFATVALTAAYCMRAWLILTRLTVEEEAEIEGLEEAVERASWESDVSLAEMFGPVLHPRCSCDARVRAARRAAPGGISAGRAGGCGCSRC